MFLSIKAGLDPTRRWYKMVMPLKAKIDWLKIVVKHLPYAMEFHHGWARGKQTFLDWLPGPYAVVCLTQGFQFYQVASGIFSGAEESLNWLELCKFLFCHVFAQFEIRNNKIILKWRRLGLQSYEIELNYTEFTWLNGFPARPPRLPQVFITRPNDQPMGRKGEMQAQVEAHDPIPDAWKTFQT